MKRKKAKKQITRCQPIFDEWLYKLGLKWWEVEIVYHHNEKSFRKDNGNITSMRCWASWQYFTFNIDVNLCAVRRADDEKLERTIVHELCHALVNEMRESDPDLKHEERVVTMLTKAFIWVRDLTREESNG